MLRRGGNLPISDRKGAPAAYFVTDHDFLAEGTDGGRGLNGQKELDSSVRDSWPLRVRPEFKRVREQPESLVEKGKGEDNRGRTAREGQQGARMTRRTGV